MATLTPQPKFRAFDSNGAPLAGGMLYTYEAGTTTPKATFSTEAGDVENTNPVVLDSDGYADVWLGDGGYKFTLTTREDVTIWTVDNIGGTSSIAFGALVNAIDSNTAITNLYANSVNICTSSPTLSLLSASSAGEGFYFSVKNQGSGVITIDPDAAETINGNATLDIEAGASALIICDGSAWYSVFYYIDTKEFSDAEFRIQDNADTTKEIAFQASGITTGTTRTITMPDEDVTLGDTILNNYITGFIMSPAGGSATLPIGAGQATDSTNSVYIRLPSTINKTTSAWAVGSGNGGLDTGTIANNTWYHVYAIRRPDTGVVDAIFSLSASSPTLPTNYTQYRRIGAWKTDGSAQWDGNIEQDGDNFYYIDPVTDVNGVQTATTRQTPALSVPDGIAVKTDIRVTTSGGVGVSFYTKVCEVAETDAAASPSNHSLGLTAAVAGAVTSISEHMSLRTNTSQQIAYRSNATDASSLIYIFTQGWTDDRGKQ